MSEVKKKVFRLKKRRAFSLVAVLFISIVGMAFVGAIMYNFQSSSGSSRVSGGSKLEYNLLQDGVEKGKAILKDFMANEDPPPEGINVGDVDELADLLLDGIGDHGVVYSRDLTGGDLAGRKGNIRVEIFDMDYNPVLNSAITPAEIAKLPPSLTIGSGGGTGYRSWGVGASSAGTSSPNSHAYLIRATLEVNDVRGVGKKIKVLDTSIVQSNLSI
jgi:hypothetical protein